MELAYFLSGLAVEGSALPLVFRDDNWPPGADRYAGSSIAYSAQYKMMGKLCRLSIVDFGSPTTVSTVPSYFTLYFDD